MKRLKPKSRKANTPQTACAEAPRAELFPMFLKLDRRPCLVVGAGNVAAPKIESLVRCGAKVHVVAPRALDAVRDAAERGVLTWDRREFRDSDLDGAFLVVAATSSPELHRHIFALARQREILCNAVDEPDRCDFYYGAVVRRGPLQIAISTSGKSPSLAQRLRQELEDAIPHEYGAWTEQIGRERKALLADGGTAMSPQRKEALRAISSAKAFDAYRRASRGGKQRTHTDRTATPRKRTR